MNDNLSAEKAKNLPKKSHSGSVKKFDWAKYLGLFADIVLFLSGAAVFLNFAFGNG